MGIIFTIVLLAAGACLAWIFDVFVLRREDQSHPFRLETRVEEFRLVASLNLYGGVAKATSAQLRQGATSDKGVKSQV